MIVKLSREGDGLTHTHIIECDTIHMAEMEDKAQSLIYTEILLYRGDSKPAATWHAGRYGIEHLFIMDKGKTVDHMRLEGRAMEQKKK